METNIESNSEESPIGAIVSDVPIPTSTAWRKPNSLASILSKMQVGDSVRLSRSVRDSVFVNAKAVGIRITTRTLDRDTFRVWRLPDLPNSEPKEEAAPVQP